MIGIKFLPGREFMSLTGNSLWPFEGMERIGSVVYRLHLPPTARIRLVFYVSQLKKYYPGQEIHFGDLPEVQPQGIFEVILEKVLKYRVIDRQGQPIQQALVQWKQLSEEEGTWERIFRN